MANRRTPHSTAGDIQERLRRSEAAAIASRHLLDRLGDSPASEAERRVVHASRIMADILAWIRLAAGTTRCVVISGEPGTGKSLLAEVIHLTTATGALFPVDCTRRPLGLPAADAIGTLVLDGIDKADAETQAELLAYLHRTGAVAQHARVISLTRRPLTELATAGILRHELVHRLQGHHLAVPPLRERIQDIPALVSAFLARACAERGLERPVLARAELDALVQRPWPGNVRELAAAVDALLTVRTQGPEVVFGPTLPTIRACVDQLIDEALRRTGGRQGAAARLLGITPQSLSERLQRRRERLRDRDDEPVTHEG
jgi:DNA-binding NtrC family response regulator